MPKSFDYEVIFPVDSIVNDMGLDDGGKVQSFVTNEILRLSDPYVPFDIMELYENPGRLRDSGHIEYDTDVVWRTPYARYLYYHPEFNFQGSPMRGGYWVDRMLQNGGLDQIEKGIRRLLHR